MTDTNTPTGVEMTDAVESLDRDIRNAAANISNREARYLVDLYYQMQDDRKRAANQERACNEAEEPNMLIKWVGRQHHMLEKSLKAALGKYAEGQQLGVWALSHRGIGPVISAGLLAHIDFNRCETAGGIWSFAGLDPNVTWHASAKVASALSVHFGETPSNITNDHIVQACDMYRRKLETIVRYMDGNFKFNELCKAIARQPWNAKLKVLCWKIGESFVKVSGNPESYYGRRYIEYRQEEDKKNEAGQLAEQAADKLRKFNIDKTTDAYKAYSQGKLPKAHLFARAKRRTVKLFLSHYFDVGYQLHHGKEPPRPWAIEFGGHSHYIPPPNRELVIPV